MYVGHHVKYPLFLSDFNKIWTFSSDFSKNTQISNFMKIRLVGAELFHADRRTGRERKHVKADNRFSKFYERAKWTRLISEPKDIVFN